MITVIDKLISNYYLIKCKFYSFLKRIKLEIIDKDSFILTKKNKKVIVKKRKLTWQNPLTIKNKLDRIKFEYRNIFLVIKYFNKLEMYNGDKEIDISKEFIINYKGHKIKTDFLQLKELEYGIESYNLQYSLKKGDIVFDFGGYHGVYSIWASAQVGETGKIYCFEPNKENYSVLLENLENNNITNVIPINKGIYNQSGKISFFKRGPGSRIIDSSFKTNTKDSICEIDVIPLSQFIKEKNITKIDFIKADIEGAEIEFVEDYLKNILPLGIKPRMAIASYHYRKDLGTNTSKQIAKEFKKNGIKVNIRNKKHECVFV